MAIFGIVSILTVLFDCLPFLRDIIARHTYSVFGCISCEWIRSYVYSYVRIAYACVNLVKRSAFVERYLR